MLNGASKQDPQDIPATKQKTNDLPTWQEELQRLREEIATIKGRLSNLEDDPEMR